MENPRDTELSSALARATRLVLLHLLVLVTGCSGEGGGAGLLSSITTNLAEGGIGGTGITSGPISAFGSVFVNGVEFQSDNASIFVNDEPATESDLGLGMIVRVEGYIDPDGSSGTATRIEFHDNVRGPVEKVDTEIRRLVVLRQEVVVDNLTIFTGVESLSGLNVGTIVDVSGYVDSRGMVHATRVSATQAARRSQANVGPGAQFDVTGTVSEADAAAQTFVIGRLRIDYSQAAVLDTVPENGQQVHVHGVLPSWQPRMLADSVTTVVEAPPGRAGDEVQVSGLVSRFVSPQDFKITGLDVTTTGNTIYRFGSAFDLATGARVEVEGQIDVTGRLVARRITYGGKTSARGAAGEISLRATIQAIDNETRSVTLLGLEARTDNTTQFSDQRDHVLRFGLLDVSVGDEVAVLGFLDAQTGELVAERLQRVTADQTSQVAVSGPWNHLNVIDGNLQVAGLHVSVDGATHITDSSGAPLTQGKLAEALSRNPGATVRAQGVDTGSGVHASTIELLVSPGAPAQY